MNVPRYLIVFSGSQDDHNIYMWVTAQRSLGILSYAIYYIHVYGEENKIRFFINKSVQR